MMILSPLLNIKLRPKFFQLLKQARNVRPIVRIGKDKFQLCVDVRNFAKDEIKVKARPEYVVIEGKQERKTKNGCVIRHFVRKFKLPSGCNPEKVKSQLSKDGYLTITAPRSTCDINLPCENVVPITYSSKKIEPPSLIEDKPDIKPKTE